MKTTAMILAMFAGSVLAADKYYWLPSAKDPAGNFTNAVHWFTYDTGTVSVSPSSLLPGDELHLRNKSGVEDSFSAVLTPGEELRSDISPVFRVPGTGKVFTFDGSGAKWVQTNLTAESASVYGQSTRFQLMTHGSTAILMSAYSNTRSGVFALDSVKFRLSYADSSNMFDLDSGTMNFYNPNATALSDHTLYFGVSINTGSYFDYRFHPGSTFKADSVLVYASATENRILFAGGSDHYIRKFILRNGSDTVASAVRTRLMLSGEGTKLTIAEIDGGSGAHRHSIEVSDGACLTMNGNIVTKQGMCDTVISGGTVAFSKAASWYTPDVSAANATIDASAVGSLSLMQGDFRMKDSRLAAKLLYVRCALSCEGGEIEAEKILGMDGVGTLSGDGTVLRAQTATDLFVSGLSRLAAGTRGLVIDSDFDIAIPQSVVNADGVEGKLILTGSGVKTLLGDASSVSRIVVAGGTLVFAEGARAASELIVTNGAKVAFAGDPSAVGLTGLSCGDDKTAGCLSLTAGQTLAVNGAVEFNRVNIELADEVENAAWKVVSAAEIASEDSAAAWAAALVVSGRDAGRSYAFTSARAAGGGSEFSLTVNNSLVSPIVALEGDKEMNEAFEFGVNNAQTFDIASTASLSVAAAIGSGELVKTGLGLLSLTSADNVFMHGIHLRQGMLSVTSPLALGGVETAPGGFRLAGGTLEVAGSGAYRRPFSVEASAAAVVKNDGDLHLSGFNAVSGCLVKRGAGRLTIEAENGGRVLLAVSKGTDTDGWDPNPKSAVFNDAGAPPTGGYLGFNVAEGEVVLKGDATTEFREPYGCLIGMQTDSGKVFPSLTVDGATARFTASNGKFHLGGFQQSGQVGRYASLNVVNGGYVYIKSFIAGRAADAYSYPTTRVDNATLSIDSFRASNSDKVRHTVVLRNQARMYLYATENWGPVDFDVENSCLQKDSSGNCIVQKFHTAGGSWRFRNGAYLALSRFETDVKKAFSAEFDGAVWETGGGGKPTFYLCNAEMYSFKTIGAGLTLPVAADKTVRVARAISGAGSLVKTGAGTLRFETQGTWNADATEKTALADPVSLAFSGVLDVREGAVEIDLSACRAGGAYCAAAESRIDFGGNALNAAEFAGCGTFANASVTDPVLKPSADGGAPRFDGVAFSGTVAVDFGLDAAPEKKVTLLVASFPGGAPSLAGWRARNDGRNVKTVFNVADNGVDVVAVLEPAGMSIILR